MNMCPRKRVKPTSGKKAIVWAHVSPKRVAVIWSFAYSGLTQSRDVDVLRYMLGAIVCIAALAASTYQGCCSILTLT